MWFIRGEGGGVTLDPRVMESVNEMPLVAVWEVWWHDSHVIVM